MTLELTAPLVKAMMGYYNEGGDWEPPAGAFGGMLPTFEEGLRLPVQNEVDRYLMQPIKYALILQRDGAACRICYSSDTIEIDHIFPRSAFDPWDIAVADRSDNLTVLCQDCNRRKSNFVSVLRKRPGVVTACWECRNPGPEDPWDYDEWAAGQPPTPYMVYCGQHGNMGGFVPDLAWVL